MVQRKEELLDAAVDLFQKNGFHATSVEEITGAIGISKGGFYKHFKSKESLVLELLNRFYEDMLEKSEQYVKGLQGEPLLVLKKKITIELEQLFDYHYFFHAIRNDSSLSDEDEIQEALKRIIEMIQEWHKQALFEAFGTKPVNYINDLSLMMEGTMHFYLMTIIWSDMDLPLDMISDFIAESLQSIVNNDGSLQPVLPRLMKEAEDGENLNLNMIDELKILRDEKNSPVEKTSQTFDLLIDELNEQQPREFLVEALFTQLSQIPELKRKLTSIIIEWEVWKENINE